MAKKYTPDELNDLSRQELLLLVTSMQDRLEQLNANMERLIEQITIANHQRFGRHSELLDVIDGQLDLFNEAEALSEEAIIHSVPEEKLIEHFGEGCYRKLPDESYKRLR